MDYDVVVVGAGPGGSTAARSCALKGLKTLLLEKEKLPRYKACGGAVSSKTASLLDFRLSKELVERECFSARLYYKEHEVEARKPYRLAALTSRDKFDFYLTEKAVDAGVELRDSERVRSLQVKDSHIVVKTDNKSYDACAVIGADGVNSIVSRHVRDRFKPSELALTLEAEIPVSGGDIENPDLVKMHFGYTYNGYGWVFPKREHLSVGIGGLLSHFKEPEKVFASFLKKQGFDPDIRFHAHLIPAGGYERKTCSDRIVLVGDAAGYVDPFLGEGIRYAIHSGRIAADIILESYNEGNFSEDRLSKYTQACFDAFGENLEYALKFSRLAYDHSDRLLKLALSNKSLFSRYLDVIGGDTCYREYMRWFLLRLPYCLMRDFISKL